MRASYAHIIIRQVMLTTLGLSFIMPEEGFLLFKRVLEIIQLLKHGRRQRMSGQTGPESSQLVF